MLLQAAPMLDDVTNAVANTTTGPDDGDLPELCGGLWVASQTEAAILRAILQDRDEGEAAVVAEGFRLAMQQLTQYETRPPMGAVVRWRVGTLLTTMTGRLDGQRHRDFVLVGCS